MDTKEGVSRTLLRSCCRRYACGTEGQKEGPGQLTVGNTSQPGDFLTFYEKAQWSK
jgi:hypothetical protein